MVLGVFDQIKGGILLQWVHGPRTVVMEDGGIMAARKRKTLQWVHGPRTVVMTGGLGARQHFQKGFNGSTVREPWLCLASGNQYVAESYLLPFERFGIVPEYDEQKCTFHNHYSFCSLDFHHASGADELISDNSKLSKSKRTNAPGW